MVYATYWVRFYMESLQFNCSSLTFLPSNVLSYSKFLLFPVFHFLLLACSAVLYSISQYAAICFLPVCLFPSLMVVLLSLLWVLKSWQEQRQWHKQQQQGSLFNMWNDIYISKETDETSALLKRVTAFTFSCSTTSSFTFSSRCFSLFQSMISIIYH